MRMMRWWWWQWDDGDDNMMVMTMMKMFNRWNLNATQDAFCATIAQAGLWSAWPWSVDHDLTNILTFFVWQFWQFVTFFVENFENFFTIFWQFWHFFLQFKKISWQFWQLLKPLFFVVDNFTIFWQLWHLLSILTLIKILSIENLKSWQSLWPDNKSDTAFVILAMFPVSRHCPYSRDFVIFPVSRPWPKNEKEYKKCLETGETPKSLENW